MKSREPVLLQVLKLLLACMAETVVLRMALLLWGGGG